MKELEKRVSRLMQKHKIPGLVLGFVGEDGLSYVRGFGSRDYWRQLPCDEHTIFGIGSVSKSFTCLAVLQLHEQGLLSMDDPVTKYLDINIPDTITLRHLMSHTSGIPDLQVLSVHIDIFCNRSYTPPVVPISSWEDLFLHIEGAADEFFPPGERFFYLNAGYTLLGKVIEVVSGEDFRQYMQGHIFEPLGMGRTGYDLDQALGDGNHAVGYNVENKPRVERASDHEFSLAPGGVLSTIADLANYLRMWMSDGSLDGRRILSPELVAAAFEPMFSSTNSSSSDFDGWGYGLGWRTYDFHGHEIRTHSGSVGVYSALVAFSGRRGVVCLTNQLAMPVDLTLELFGALVGVAAVGPTFDQHLDSLAGTYSSYKEVVSAKVFRINGSLMVELSRGGKLALVAEDAPLPMRFHAVTSFNGRILVEFIKRGEHLELAIERNLFRKCG